MENPKKKVVNGRSLKVKPQIKVATASTSDDLVDDQNNALRRLRPRSGQWPVMTPGPTSRRGGVPQYSKAGSARQMKESTRAEPNNSLLLSRFISDKEITSISNVKKRKSSVSSVVSSPRKSMTKEKSSVVIKPDVINVTNPEEEEEEWDPPRRVNLLAKFEEESQRNSEISQADDQELDGPSCVNISTPKKRKELSNPASPDTVQPSTPETSPTLVSSIRTKSGRGPTRKSFRAFTPSADDVLAVGLRRKIDFLDLDLEVRDEVLDDI